MYPLIAKISTTVRKLFALYGLRLWFAIGGLVAPRRAFARAARIFCTPMSSSRTRALAAPTFDARVERLTVDDDTMGVLNRRAARLRVACGATWLPKANPSRSP